MIRSVVVTSCGCCVVFVVVGGGCGEKECELVSMRVICTWCCSAVVDMLLLLLLL